jgi:hypothetical protein
MSNSVENLPRKIREFVNRIKTKGTNYNSRYQLSRLKLNIDNAVKNSVGKVTFNAIKNRLILPPNKVIENQRRANNRRRINPYNRTKTTRHVKTPHGFI